VWVVVQDPEGGEQLLGQYDDALDMTFIPFYLEKEEALEGMTVLARDQARKYEPQAMLYSHLAEHASQNGMKLHLMDRSGRVLEILTP
jgi:hypothetical protein